MTKRLLGTAGPRAAPATERVQLTVRLLRRQMRQLRTYAFVTGRSHQELTEEALAQFFRQVKLPPEQARQIKVMLSAPGV